jgi:hypothetical protein
LRPSSYPKTINAKQPEAQVWRKASQFIANPNCLFAEAKARISQLQKEYDLNKVKRSRSVLRLRF